MKRQSYFNLFLRTSATATFFIVHNFTDTCVGVVIIAITAIIIIISDFISSKPNTKITPAIPSKSYAFNVKLLYPLLEVKR